MALFRREVAGHRSAIAMFAMPPGFRAIILARARRVSIVYFPERRSGMVWLLLNQEPVQEAFVRAEAISYLEPLSRPQLGSPSGFVFMAYAARRWVCLQSGWTLEIHRARLAYSGDAVWGILSGAHRRFSDCPDRQSICGSP